MNTTQGFARTMRGFATRHLLAAVLAGGVALTAGAAVVAHQGGGGHHFGGMMFAMGGPQDMAEHVDRMLQHVYIEVGATDAQKAQLDPIVKQAATDLLALRDQVHVGHGEMLAMLTEDHIDRAKLETARVAHIDVADQASRRIVQLIADVGDVLTVEQRKTLAARIAEHHGARHE
ncbi:MAG: periplasmic heavy metal sensor [Tahibacter sp.]